MNKYNKAIIYILFGIIFIAFLFSFSDDSTQTGNVIKEMEQEILILDNTYSLKSNDAIYLPLELSTIVRQIRVNFKGEYPVSILFVSGEEDYKSFLKGEVMTYYYGCIKENITMGEVSCDVSKGGLILSNPNLEINSLNVKIYA